jgi:hypothetical protein
VIDLVSGKAAGAISDEQSTRTYLGDYPNKDVLPEVFKDWLRLTE